MDQLGDELDILVAIYRWIRVRRRGVYYLRGYRRGLAAGKDEPEAFEIVASRRSPARNLAQWFRGYRDGHRERERRRHRNLPLPHDTARWAQPMATDEQYRRASRNLGHDDPSTLIPRDEWERIKRRFLE